MVAVALAVFMASVDMSIVNVALPAIERDFEIATSMTEWTVLAYLLPLAGLALSSGRWLDSVGRRPAWCSRSPASLSRASQRGSRPTWLA